ncbi:WhiB family transcriptional regulator [Nocardia sp. CNY236]|uniref:WhiB family transcriptional regulator n=1 Tax=Nocardia sp. CNY236 TaxID=1169152 RepID=UPI0004214AC0|nr:WhiB family transcriptional regulator [Nocardia sp. CNY236]
MKTRPVDTAIPTWRDRAACRDHDPELWFPFPSQSSAVVRAVCVDCPVRRACGAEALSTGEEYGIRAGFSMDDERAALRAFLDVTSGLCDTCGREMHVKINLRTCAGCRRIARGDAGDHEAVRKHIVFLREVAGMTILDIANGAGVARATVRDIGTGVRTAITADTASRILSVEPVGVRA